MVKEEEIMAEAGGRGYMDMLGLGDEAMADYFLCPSPSSSYLSSAAVSTTTTNASTHAAAASPTCASYLPPLAGPYRHILSFGGRAEQQYPGAGGDMFGALQYYYHGAGGGHAVPVAVPQKSSPTTECSSSISSMSSSPTATAVSAPKPQPPKKKGSRSSDQRKAAAAPAAAAGNKRPRVRRERLGERILALQQLVSPFGKTDTASVLHEALGYIRFLHEQVQVLSSPYMQRLPPSAPRAPEPPRAPSDLRSRGLCLVPLACTDHVAGGSGNGADVWSTVAAMGLPADQDQEEDKAAMLRGDRHPGQLA
ncbi:hypothetical protein QYE76_061664 [Lolium multiflorum]|uniref:BHLH domain-containing protein n=1 Tax=Lolium multiflorum TaxID=4521 RepID=A0AAD8S1H4_LOLMU|nr:hypothetical protein QYE76_061664 [Lolium multiflorum]